MSPSSGEELLANRCQRRDPEALKDFTRQYGRPLYGFVHTLLGERAELVHDALIQSCLQTFRSLQSERIVEPIKVKLLRDLVKRILARLRVREGAKSRVVLEPRLAVIYEGLRALPWDERVLILLRDQMELSQSEIAAVLGIPKDKVFHALKNAHLALREKVHGLLKQLEGMDQ